MRALALAGVLVLSVPGQVACVNPIYDLLCEIFEWDPLFLRDLAYELFVFE